MKVPRTVLSRRLRDAYLAFTFPGEFIANALEPMYLPARREYLGAQLGLVLQPLRPTHAYFGVQTRTERYDFDTRAPDWRKRLEKELSSEFLVEQVIPAFLELIPTFQARSFETLQGVSNLQQLLQSLDRYIASFLPEPDPGAGEYWQNCWFPRPTGHRPDGTITSTPAHVQLYANLRVADLEIQHEGDVTALEMLRALVALEQQITCDLIARCGRTRDAYEQAEARLQVYQGTAV